MAIGTPDTVDDVLALQDTVAWATELPIFPYTQPGGLSSYNNATAIQGGLGEYAVCPFGEPANHRNTGCRHGRFYPGQQFAGFLPRALDIFR